MFQKSFWPFFSVILFSSLLTISYSSFAQPVSGDNVSIQLLPEKTEAKGGETITIGIEETIADGWHTYWTNPGDSGTAARIAWTGLSVEASPIQWPIPKKIPIGPLTNFGYEQKVVLLQDLTLPKDLPEGPQELTATVDILVCHEICIPETHTASFTLNDSRDAAADAVEEARAQLPIDAGWAANMHEKDGDLVVTIDTDTPSAFSKLKTIELYPEEWGLILNTVETRAEKSGSTLTLHEQRGERALSEVPVSKLVIVYEDANGERKGVRVSALTGTATNAAENPGAIKLWEAFLFAFLGGIILNLMPCVFPVLSMKALSLVHLKDKEIAIARKHGIAYMLGILAMFTVIAGALLALKAGGMQIGWGFQLQHPGVILFLAYLFFMLGLNLAGYFEINFGLSNVGQQLTTRSDTAGSFFTGMLATLVATPCTAPFMGAATGFALTQSPIIAIGIFLALGFGLSLPYLALSFVPALRHILPKPGAWMERLRQFLAFPMFLSSCWLIWILSQQVSHMGQFAALLGMVAIAFSLWLWKYRPRHIAGHLFYVVVILASLGFVLSTFFTMKPMEEKTARAPDEQQNWEDFSQARLQEYLEGDDPIFVNMTAAWCITCKVNEKVALATETTQALFKTHNVRYLKGDWTNQNPEITAFLEEYGRSGVPIYVYYGPRVEKHGVRPEPVVLPQILTPGLIEKAIEPQGEQE